METIYVQGYHNLNVGGTYMIRLPGDSEKSKVVVHKTSREDCKQRKPGGGMVTMPQTRITFKRA